MDWFTKKSLRYVLEKLKVVIDNKLESMINDEETSEKTTWSSKEINSKLEELGESVAEGKSSIASALTDSGVTTASDATFEVLSNNVYDVATNQYDAGKNSVKLGTRSVSQSATKDYWTATGANLDGLTRIDIDATGVYNAGANAIYATQSTTTGSWNGATYTASSSAGYKASSTSTTITTVAAKTYGPSTSAQTVASAGTRAYFSGAVTISAAYSGTLGAQSSSSTSSGNRTISCNGYKMTGNVTITPAQIYSNTLLASSGASADSWGGAWGYAIAGKATANFNLVAGSTQYSTLQKSLAVVVTNSQSVSIKGNGQTSAVGLLCAARGANIYVYAVGCSGTNSTVTVQNTSSGTIYATAFIARS